MPRVSCSGNLSCLCFFDNQYDFRPSLYGAAILTAVHLLKVNLPPSIGVLGAVAAGIPGLVIQIVLIPAMVYLAERRMRLESN